jgi:hypothetical protein
MQKFLRLGISAVFFVTLSSFAKGGDPLESKLKLSTDAAAKEVVPEYKLTTDEEDLLRRGEISQGSYITGGIFATVLGFGSGQMIQGRYADANAWIYTIGDAASTALVAVGAGNAFGCLITFMLACDQSDLDDASALMGVGVAGFVVFRVLQSVDAWSGPPRHNQRVRELKARTGWKSSSWYFLPTAPTLAGYTGRSSGVGMTAGLSFQW